MELLARVRTDARKEACEKVLNTDEGRRLAEKAGGKDFEVTQLQKNDVMLSKNRS